MTSDARPLSLHVTLEPSPDAALVAALHAGLQGDDPPALRPRDRAPFAVVLRDDEGGLAGGLLGATMWRWLLVDVLWVAPAWRGQGFGRRLLDEAERHATALGCTDATLGTFDFQARGFYARAGYAVYGRLENFPAGHTHFHLRKSLASAAGAVEGARAPDASSVAAAAGDLALLPPELAASSASSREIVLPLDAAVAAIERLAHAGHRVEAWEGWLELPGGTRTASLAHTGSFALPTTAARAAAVAIEGMRRSQARFDRAPEYPGARLFFRLTIAR